MVWLAFLLSWSSRRTITQYSSVTQHNMVRNDYCVNGSIWFCMYKMAILSNSLHLAKSMWNNINIFINIDSVNIIYTNTATRAIKRLTLTRYLILQSKHLICQQRICKIGWATDISNELLILSENTACHIIDAQRLYCLFLRTLSSVYSSRTSLLSSSGMLRKKYEKNFSSSSSSSSSFLVIVVMIWCWELTTVVLMQNRVASIVRQISRQEPCIHSHALYLGMHASVLVLTHTPHCMESCGHGWQKRHAWRWWLDYRNTGR